ncbi:MAG TPA: FAD/NAD(P)-binding oxidoreductase, partial [Chthonomonadales bacterium]|nr:FAD/NAD(P)-binding oxidoreductase [Chthonomonadales bacterium]
MEERYQYVLVGGGLASVSAAQAIRETDKEGKILLIGDEPHPPYDRPPFSKNFITNDEMTPDDGYSKYDDFYPKNTIELHTKTRVTRLDASSRTITLDSGKTVTYEKLLLATGSHALPLKVPGADRQGVFTLRHIEDSISIRDAMRQSKRAVIVGASYMGMELAADACSRGLETVVIERQSHVWPKFSSKALGDTVQGYFEGKGVRFLLNDEPVEFAGDAGSSPVTAVKTKSGETVRTDLIVCAVGVALNTELASQAGLEADPGTGVQVNEYLQTSNPAIWAAGDVASFKDLACGQQWHLEHFLNAKWQGQAAGKIMSGGSEPYNQVPYFFSDFLDLHMILRGDPSRNHQSIFAGDRGGMEFTELYYDQGGRLTMGISISHDEKRLDPISDTLERLLKS